MISTAFSRTNRKVTRQCCRLLVVVTTVSILYVVPCFGQADLALEEVLVSAQKRSEAVQQVPISISAISEQFIQEVGAYSLNDLGLYIPGLETRVTQSTQPSYTVRGITTDDFGIGVDPAVAVYIDGVYSGRSAAAMTAFQDIKRVEVLKGPQGTLFGKNAAAGAIHIISKPPVDEFETSVAVEFGSYKQRKIDLTANVPLTDTLLLRLNAMDHRREGYRENLATGHDVADINNSGERATLLWHAGQHTNMIFRIEHVDLDQDAQVHYSLLNPGDPYGDVRFDAPIEETLALWAGSLVIETQLEGMSFTSTSAYKSFESNNLRDEDGTDIAQIYFTSENVEENSFYSQELRLVSTEESLWHWTMGAMYSKESAQQHTRAQFATELVDRTLLSNPQIAGALALYNTLFNTEYTADTAPSGFGFDIALETDPANMINWGTPLGVGQSLLGQMFAEVVSGELRSTSIAAYADSTYPVTQLLNITTGLRYTRDEKDYTLGVVANEFGFGVAYPPTPFEMQTDSWDNLSWRVVADYNLAEDMMAYLSVATGYKAGGFNSTEKSSAFDEEQLINYELGFKSTLFDRRLRLNAALFFYQYKDLQDLATVLDSTSGISELRLRSVDAEGQGGELSSMWRATEQLTLSANYSYIDTEITQFQLFAGETANSDRTGKSLSSVPSHTLNLSTHYSMMLSTYGIVDLRLDYSFVGDREMDSLATATPAAQQLIRDYQQDFEGAYQNINARISFYHHSETWQLALFVKNLTDEHYLLELGSLGASIGSPVADRAPGRTVGVASVYYFR